jgi:hypothetical protein
MSAINDALSKVQQQRKEAAAVKAAARSPLRRVQTIGTKAPGRAPLYVWVLANLAVISLLVAGYFFFFRDSVQTIQPAVVLPAPISAPEPVPLAQPAKSGPSAAPESIRVTRAPEAQVARVSDLARPYETVPADGEYELSGMTAVGESTLLSITRRSDRSSFWITVGKTVGEVTAISYSPETNDARIRVRGQVITIRRR